MDLTPFFCQLVTQKGRDEAVGTNGKNGDKKSGSGAGNSLFNTKLSELVASITYMRDYLISNKKDYINIYNSILSMASTMTDEERDQIDKDVQDFVKLCNDVIKILRVEIKSHKCKQQFEHENNAILMVEAYIKAIHEFHNKQKALRLRRNLDSQNFFRLSKSLKGVDSVTTVAQDKSPRTAKREANNVSKSDRPISKNAKNTSKSNYIEDEADQNQTANFGLSNEELKMFKDEGARIYDEMNSMGDEVKNIGKKLTEIAKLQEAFSESVLKQEMDLSHLNSTTITSTEYIREGNEQLREAMRKNAGFRVMVLFFITTLAFVVLFLDWYNG